MVEYVERDGIVEVARHAYNEWNLAMAAADGNREINRVYKMQELCKAVEAVAKAAPAADVAPVVRGHWNVRCDSHHDTYTGETDETFYLECSECKRKVWDVDQTAAMNGDYGKMVADFPYCHCGAKMERGVEK